MNKHFNSKTMLSVGAFLMLCAFCFEFIVSMDGESPAQQSLIEERNQILDDLQTIEFKIDTLREQLTELEDSLLKKNERLVVIEGQLGSSRL